MPISILSRRPVEIVDPFMLAAQTPAMRRVIQANGDVRRMRTNTLLTDDQWKEIDTEVIRAAEERLRIVADMRAGGLVHQLGGFGVLESEFHRISDMEPAEQSMSGAGAGDRDLPEKEISIVPIPVTFKEWEIELRFLESSRIRGEPIDVTAAGLAGRQVAEKLEDMVFNGGDILLSGNQIYGLTNFPDRATYTSIVDWTTDGGATILADVLAMIQLLHDVNYFGPYDLYVAGNYWLPLQDDFKANSDKTIMQRLLELPDLNAIKVADKLADGNVILLQMTRDVLDLAVAQDIVSVDWEIQGGAIGRFKVMTALAPRLKSDYNGATGICHGS
jgi:uncharacterized linocin/CFP29 family protein